MIPLRRDMGGSLSRRVLLVAAAHTGLLLMVLFALFYQSAAMRDRLERATAAYVEEQAIADRISNAVSRELVTALAYRGEQGGHGIGEFRIAAEDAYREIRRYLFRDLSPAQRLQLERVKEQHQRLEVAAVRALDVASRDGATAPGSADAVARHGVALHNAVDAFLRMREADLTQLRVSQAAAFRALSWGGGILALLMVLSALVNARFLYRRLAAPLAELSRAAEQVGGGDMAARAPGMRDHEFQALADSFNRMADGLAAARGDLEHRNRQLQRALRRLSQTQDELVRTEKLSAVGRMMAGLAHELNNPLAGVLGYGQLLDAQLTEKPHPGAPTLREDLVTPLVSEATRARALVHTLLRFSRNSDEELCAVPLSEPLGLVQTLRGYSFEQAGLNLRIEDTDARVMAESQRLQQVLLNIVNNAFDAMSGAGRGTLSITVHQDGPHTVVVCDDEGPGFIDPDRAFEPFYTTKPVGAGTGLGLALVHKFLEEFGGSAVAQNREGQGARITLTFRTATEAEYSTGNEPAEDGGTELMPLAIAPAPKTFPSERRPTILVVEDEAPLRNLHGRLLARLGVHVLLAASAEHARQILDEQDADLVISDVRMPGESGLDLFRWVQKKRPLLVDRFLFVTGDVGDPSIANFASTRPDRLLRKPFQMEDYLRRVGELLAAARA